MSRKLFFAIPIIIIIFILSILPLISATQEDLGVFKKGSCIELIQLCGDCTFNNISSIQYPNETKVILDVPMTQRGTEFNYTYCFPELNGQYNINGVGDLGGENTVWAYTLTLTPNGEMPTTSKIFLHYGSISVLVLFLIMSIAGIIHFEDYKGRFALYWVSHVLLIAITFMLWNGAVNLLTSAPFVISFFRLMFLFVMISAFPMVILSLAWIYHMHLTCDEIMSMMERGMDENEAFKRVSRRKKR